MALIVEDGSGKTTANSYCSVADADAYHTLFTRSSEWAAAAPAARENALVLATQYLDLKYGGRWRGYQASVDQALDWPRVLAYTPDGWAYDDDVLPVRIVQATCEAALRVVQGDELLAAVTDPGALVSESITVGPISESKSYAGPKPYGYLYRKIDTLVRALISEGGQVVRG